MPSHGGRPAPGSASPSTGSASPDRGLYVVGGAAAGIDDRGGDGSVAAIDALAGLALARLAALGLGAVVDEA